jgi:AcrR family transcriptional regulator
VTPAAASASNSDAGASPARPYRGVPADTRRSDRRERLLAAGLELFGTKGIAETRVDEVCAEAGLTKRYFYENFNSLDELVHAVVENVIADLSAVVLPVIAASGWRNPRPALSAFIDALLADPRLVRLLVLETHLGSLAARRQEFIERAVDLWLLTDPGASKDPEHLPAQRLLAHAMGGAAGEVALAWVNGRIDMPAEQITDHLVRIFERITPRRKRSTQAPESPSSS